MAVCNSAALLCKINMNRKRFYHSDMDYLQKPENILWQYTFAFGRDEFQSGIFMYI